MGSKIKFLVLCFLIILLMTSVLAQPRIAGGQPAVYRQFKFVVALEIKTNLDALNSVTSYCTGSLISEGWVISAAHCLAAYIVVADIMGLSLPARTLVLAGDLEAQRAFTNQMTYGQMEISFKNYTHPDAFSLQDLRRIARRLPNRNFITTFAYLRPHIGEAFDVALYKLYRNFFYNSDVGPIKLAKYYNWGYQQGTCYTMGYGMKNASDATNNRDLNYIPVHVGGLNFCKSAEPNITFDQEYHVCVRGKEEFENVCIGDSGGPVVCGEHGKPYYLYGVGSSSATIGVRDTCGKSKIITHKFIFPNHAADWIGWITHLVDFQEPTSEQDSPYDSHEEFAAPTDFDDLDDPDDPAAAPASGGPFLAFEATLFALVVFKSSWDIINYYPASY